MQRHYSAIFSSIAASFFSLRVHNEFHSLECYQFVAAEDSRGKYISSLVGLPNLPREDWHIKSFTTNK